MVDAARGATEADRNSKSCSRRGWSRPTERDVALHLHRATCGPKDAVVQLRASALPREWRCLCRRGLTLMTKGIHVPPPPQAGVLPPIPPARRLREPSARHIRCSRGHGCLRISHEGPGSRPGAPCSRGGRHGSNISPKSFAIGANPPPPLPGTCGLARSTGSHCGGTGPSSSYVIPWYRPRHVRRARSHIRIRTPSDVATASVGIIPFRDDLRLAAWRASIRSTGPGV